MDAPHRSRTGLVALFLAATLSCFASLPALAAAFPPPSVNVPSAVLMTIDGTVLWSRKPDAARQTASTIKLLNAWSCSTRSRPTGSPAWTPPSPFRGKPPPSTTGMSAS